MNNEEYQRLNNIYHFQSIPRGARDLEVGTTYFFLETAVDNYRGRSGRPKYIGTYLRRVSGTDIIIRLEEYLNDPVIKLRNYTIRQGRPVYYNEGDEAQIQVFEDEIFELHDLIKIIPNYVRPARPAPRARAPRAATVITNDNIHDLLQIYFDNRNNLPADLRNIPIGNWDVSRVTDMSALFSMRETFNEPLNDWNVSNVTDMESMFQGASSFNQPLDRWDISNVRNMRRMFWGTSLSQNPNWNVRPNVNTEEMLRDTPLARQRRGRQTRAPAAAQPPPPPAEAPRIEFVISNNNIRGLVDTYMSNRDNLPPAVRNIPIGNWDVSRVTNMSALFAMRETFNEPLNDWNVSNVTDMESMFQGATSFNQPLDRWNISNVRNMRRMFNGASSFSQNPNWNLRPNVDTTDMFQGTPLERGQAPRARAAPPAEATIITNDNIRDLVNAYIHYRNRLPEDLRNIPIGNWDVSRVTNMRLLFLNKYEFNEPLNDWNVSNVTDMTSMFEDAIEFNQPLDRWDISRVTNMNSMFKNTSLSQDPNWNISPNVNTRNMFQGTPLARQRRGRAQRAPAAAQPAPAEAPAPRARTRAPAAPAARPPPPPPAEEPGGVAFEIHNAFDRFKLNEFIGLIESKSYFINRDRPLQPLIDNINANPANSAEVKRDLTAKLNRIFTTLSQYGGYETNKDKIIKCIQYVLMQPQEFIDTYIQTLITDCLKAYSSGRQESCVKGVYERIFYSFRDTIATICLDQMQGTGPAPLCKPEYITLFEYFYETWPKEGPGGLNEYTQEWYGDGEAVSALSPENRIESFVDFVRRKINNAARFRQAEASIRRYANEDLQNMGLFGGKKRSKKRTKRTIKRNKKTMKKRR